MTYSYSSYTTNTSALMRSSQLRPKDIHQPLDTISSIVWDTNNNQPTFITSSWDGYVRAYSIKNNQVERIWQMFLQHPVLCTDINSDGIIFAGLASGNIIAIMLSNNNIVELGSHQAPICGLYWIKQKGCLMTLGFDNFIKFWILDSNNPLQKQYQLPLKTVTCSLDFPFLLIGSVQTTICILNLKNLPNINIPNSPQKYLKTTIDRFSKLNCSKINSSGNVIGLGTIDGRAYNSKFRQDYNGSFDLQDQYITRVQKRQDRGAAVYAQVNTFEIGYHNYQTFSIIGGSQDLAVYNTTKKIKCKSLVSVSTTNGATTVARLNPKNQYLVFATGSDWLKGLYELENMKKPKITVIKLTNTDLNEYTAK